LIGGEAESGKEFVTGIDTIKGVSEAQVASLSSGDEFLLAGPLDTFGRGDQADRDARIEGVLENAGGPEVFTVRIAALMFDTKGEVVPPAGVDVEAVGIVGEDEFHRAFRGGEYEVFGAPAVPAGFIDGPPGALVKLDGGVKITAGEHGLKLELHRFLHAGIGREERVSDDDGIASMDERDGFFDDVITDLVTPERTATGAGKIKGQKKLVTLGMDHIGKFVGGKVVDAVSTHNHAFFYTGKDHITLDGRLGGDDEKAVIFAGVGAGDGA
jgi:hypothetical protein